MHIARLQTLPGQWLAKRSNQILPGVKVRATRSDEQQKSADFSKIQFSYLEMLEFGQSTSYTLDLAVSRWRRSIRLHDQVDRYILASGLLGSPVPK